MLPIDILLIIIGKTSNFNYLLCCKVFHKLFLYLKSIKIKDELMLVKTNDPFLKFVSFNEKYLFYFIKYKNYKYIFKSIDNKIKVQQSHLELCIEEDNVKCLKTLLPYFSYNYDTIFELIIYSCRLGSINCLFFLNQINGLDL